MKVLVVDDEKHVRDAIKMLVDWENYHIETILEASDGSEAKEIIESENPQFIFTDVMMPFMSGIELLEWIHLHAPWSKTIVISGHDDFNFIRHTMKHGGLDYILKPIDQEQLEEAFSQAVKTWIKEEKFRNQQQERNIEINQIKEIYWDKIFTDLIQEPKIYFTVANQMESGFGLNHETTNCQIAILSIDAISQSVKAKYAKDQSLLFFILANIANEIMRNNQMGYAFRYYDELLIISWRKFDLFHSLVSQINNGICLTMGEHVDFGIGSIKKFPEGILESYMEANTALRQRNLLAQETRIHDFTYLERPIRVQSSNFEHFKENIYFAIRSNSSEKINAAVGEWIYRIKQLPYITIEDLEFWWNEYAMFKIRLLNNIEEQSNHGSLKKDHFLIPLDGHGRLALDNWETAFTRELIFFSSQLSRSMHIKNNVIFEIANYIEQNYQKDIPLQFFSDQFFYSREYISRKFKQEFHENISDYIERIRIEKAKILLLNPQFKVLQISEMVGYNDEKYFSKVFKNAVGMSPNQFRKVKSGG